MATKELSCLPQPNRKELVVIRSMSHVSHIELQQHLEVRVARWTGVYPMPYASKTQFTYSTEQMTEEKDWSRYNPEPEGPPKPQGKGLVIIRYWRLPQLVQPIVLFQAKNWSVFAVLCSYFLYFAPKTKSNKTHPSAFCRWKVRCWRWEKDVLTMISPAQSQSSDQKLSPAEQVVLQPSNGKCQLSIW